MNLSLSDEQQMLADMFARLFAKESSIERVRAAASAGYDPALWQAFVASGAHLARVPEADGGLGLSLLDAALIVEEAGRNLATIPVIEAMVAARLVARFADPAGDWPQRIAKGMLVTLGMPREYSDGVLVPGGAAAQAVLALAGGQLVLARTSEARPVMNSGGIALSALELSGPDSLKLAGGAAAEEVYAAALLEWRLLSAAWLAGLSRKALDLASAYANEREQFGRPVGTFQGLAHPLADAVTRIDGGRLLCWKAIAAIASGAEDAGGLSELAWWWMCESSAQALRQAIRTLGGYGLSLEYDLHLYHRRGTAAILLGGPAERALAQAGEMLFGERRLPLPDAGEVTISFAPSQATRDHMARLEAHFTDHWDERMRAKAHHSSASHDREFHASLAQNKLIFGSWPTEHGGCGQGPAEDFATTLIFEKWNYTSHVLAITNMVGQVVMRFGSKAARQEILPRIKTGAAICSLGFSEPGSGSDVFAARTTAVRKGDDWIVNGQKMFTTGGHYADYVLLLTRTDPDVAKHNGLTLFVVPTALQGYDAQAVHTYQDERTNITFYSDMHVPDRYRLGEVGGGAAVLGTALSLEHGGANYFSGHVRLLENAIRWAREGASGARPIDDPLVRSALARVRARYEVAHGFVTRSICGAEAGETERHWGSMAKLFITESFVDNAWEMMEASGTEALATGAHPLGMVELDHRRAYGTTIYGGTSEIHRSVVAEQALGLPKSRS